MSYFTKKVTFTPGTGIGGVSIKFVLKGSKGATHFVLITNWTLPEITDAQDQNQNLPQRAVKPIPFDLGYHSYVQINYCEQKMEPCDILDKCDGCYYAGSTYVEAEEVYEKLLREGDDGVWDALKEHYDLIFNEVTSEDIEKAKIKND